MEPVGPFQLKKLNIPCPSLGYFNSENRKRCKTIRSQKCWWCRCCCCCCCCCCCYSKWDWIYSECVARPVLIFLQKLFHCGGKFLFPSTRTRLKWWIFPPDVEVDDDENVLIVDDSSTTSLEAKKMSASSVGSFLTLCVTFYSGFFEAVLMFSSDRDRREFRTTTTTKQKSRETW